MLLQRLHIGERETTRARGLKHKTLVTAGGTSRIGLLGVGDLELGSFQSESLPIVSRDSLAKT